MRVVKRSEAPSCTTGNTIRQAARRMTAAGCDSLAVVDGEGRITGLVTSAAILTALAAADFDPNRSVESLMDKSPVTTAPDVTVSQAALAVGVAGVAAITEGGGAGGRLHGLVTVADLDPAFGDHPSSILLAIPKAPSTEALRRLQQRARAFALDRLTVPSAVEWLAEFLHRIDIAVLQRLAVLMPPPSADYCWSYFGAAGGRTPVAVGSAQHRDRRGQRGSEGVFLVVRGHPKWADRMRLRRARSELVRHQRVGVRMDRAILRLDQRSDGKPDAQRASSVRSAPCDGRPLAVARRSRPR